MNKSTVQKEKITPLYRVARAILRPLHTVLFLPTYINRENIPENGKCIICSNHISLLDPVFIVFGVKRQVHFMAKSGLFKNPIASWFFRAIGTFPVNRDSAVDTTAINNSISVLSNDHVMGIFPEGTRTKDGEIGRFKAGAVMLAVKENAPLVPTAIYIKRGKGGLFCKPVVAFGEPVTTTELGITEDSPKQIREASRVLCEKVKELQQTVKGR